jgi:hypothetical protein
VKAIFRRRHDEAVYTVTDAHRPMSEDIGYRERRYLITMGIRALCFLLSILFAVTLHGYGRWLAIVALIGANGGREPDSSARFAPYEPESRNQKPISGPRDQNGS